MRSPFKFLDSYDREDQAIFFGREAETERLLEMVFQTPLLLLYGMSGTGKTSLVQCGLASTFAGPDWLPLWIRRRENINDSLKEAIQSIWPKDQMMPATLKDQVALLYRYYLRPIYLIIDQFEELFILGDEGHQEENLFTENLRELLELDLPCKVILSIREEFIGQLYRMEQQIPSIYDFRLRLEPMGRAKVKEVIEKSFDRFRVGLEHPENDLDLICDQLSAGKSGIQLPFLQIYLDQLYKSEFQRSYPQAEVLVDSLQPLTFKTSEIKAFGNIEKVLEQFLQEQQRTLERLLRQGRYGEIKSNTIRQVLDAFVTEEGTKRMIPYEQVGNIIQPKTVNLQLFPPIAKEALSLLLQRLIDNRLLRQESERLELSHDSLAALIDRSRSDQERQFYQLQSRIILAEKDFAQTGEYLSTGVLGQVDELEDDLRSRLEPKHLVFVIESRKKRKEELTEKNKVASRYAMAIGWVVALILILVAGKYKEAFDSVKTNRRTLPTPEEIQEIEQAILNQRNAEVYQKQVELLQKLNRRLLIDPQKVKEGSSNQIGSVEDLSQEAEVSNSLIDLRDNNFYQTLKHHEWVWMATNLDFEMEESWYYPDKEIGYGRLYTWEAAKKACPEGWHLPTAEEWEELAAVALGRREFHESDSTTVYDILIKGGKMGFDNSYMVYHAGHFSAQLGGYRQTNGSFDKFGKSGYYWSATKVEQDRASYYLFNQDNMSLRQYNGDQTLGLSVRCVKDF